MFKFLTKSLIVTALWKHYKRLIISSAVLFASYFVIAAAHRDFLEYAQKIDSRDYVGISYVVKWLVYVCITGAFYWLNTLGEPSSKPAENEEKIYTMQSNNRRSEKQATVETTDVFDSIRKKGRLRSRADVQMAEQKRNK